MALVDATTVSAQSAGRDDELEEESSSDKAQEGESAAAADASAAEDAKQQEQALAAPVPAPAPPAAPSPFQFSFKGTVALTLFAQDATTITGNGGAALMGPAPILGDSWFAGGDIRQTRISFNVRGPELLGAIPLANVEFEMYGGNQVTTVPAPPSVAVVRDAMGNPIGTTNVPMFASSAQGDESLLPRLRTAYVEFNWDSGTNILRAGQYHNLLLAMVSASGAHPATLGYGAGQLGWRAPGLTYVHRFHLSSDVNLDAAVQVNRNSWNDNAPTCTPTMAPPTMNCLPQGVSLGEAGLPQVEARLLLSGGLAESPFPLYAPTVWQAHIVGHWDQKDLSGVNAVAPVTMRDALTTYAVEIGGKVRLGPVLFAANGWYGQNTGGLFGNLFQMQAPDKPDVVGFGAWGQLGISFSKNFSAWAFGGIDNPNHDQALAAGLTRLQNVQLAGMLAYVDGPLVLALEWLSISTLNLVPGAAATAMTAATPSTEVTYRGNQPSFTISYSF